MSERWENIVEGEELKKARAERSRTYITRKELSAAIPALEADGWEVISTYKDGKHVKVGKNKPIGDLFENKVWMMFYSMGFKRLNRDNQFEIPYEKNDPNQTQQIDVLAVDDEIALVVECKTANKPGTSKDFKTEIEAYKYKINGIIREIKKQYSGVEVKFIWATQNIVLGKDKDRLKDFIYFDEKDIDYYTGLAKHLGSSAKYQLLGRLFKNKTVKNMQSTVPAIRGKMGGHTYYSFSIEPEWLLKIGYVLHRNDANRGMMPTYQRIIKKNRLQQIRRFVEGGGYFPNSIIISIDAPKKKGLRFDLAGSAGASDSQTTLGILHLPQKYCSAYIIDGQHRLYGYSETEYAAKNTVPVVAFENLDQSEQVRLFMEINENQKAVPKNLRNTLNADMLWLSDNYNERRKALRLKIAQALGETLSSPLYDRVLIGENTTTVTRCITMESIDKGLREGHFFTKFSDNQASKVGTFDGALPDNEYAYDRLMPFLIESLTYIQNGLPDEWSLGKEAQGILTTTTGVYAMLHLFSDIIDYLVAEGRANPKSDSASSLIEKCSTFLDLIIDFYKTIPDDLRQEIKKQYGDSGATNHWRRVQKYLHDKLPGFDPPGLEDWWADNSKMFNEKSDILLNAIELSIEEEIAKGLQTINGDSWQQDGLPLPIRLNYAKKLTQLNEERKHEGQKPVSTWSLLTISDYAVIATTGSNWTDYFRSAFTRPESQGKRGTKADKTQWINDMGKYRSKLAKPGSSITRSEYEYIQAIAQWRCPDTYAATIQDDESTTPE